MAKRKHKSKNNNGVAEIGRPTVMTSECLAKIEEGYRKGYNDREACLYAGIAEATLYRYQQDTPGFKERKALLRSCLTMRAKDKISEEVPKDAELSLKVLERLQKEEWSKNQPVSINANIQVVPTTQWIGQTQPDQLPAPNSWRDSSIDVTPIPQGDSGTIALECNTQGADAYLIDNQTAEAEDLLENDE